MRDDHKMELELAVLVILAIVGILSILWLYFADVP